MIPTTANTASQCLDAIRRFADATLVGARPERSPLFADYWGPDPRAPAYRLLFGRDRPGALSNFAAQHHLMRLLVGATQITGEGRYRAAAEDAAAFLLRRFTDPTGLPAWGGHVAITVPDHLVAFESAKQPVHELKFSYPDYALLWSIDDAATRQLVEAFWNAHVVDWSRLDFDRHGRYLTPVGRVWQSQYVGGDVFFWGKGLTFVNTGSDLYFAAALLTRLSGEPLPLTWAKRLAHRYVETRHPGVGISGYQFSQSAAAWCDGPGVRGDRAAHAYGSLIPPGHRICEGTLFRPRPVVQRCQLFLAGELKDRGIDFATWAADELGAWARVAYRARDNSFVPMLTDGYTLEGLVMKRDGYFGPHGRVDTALPADADFLWAYTTAFRTTRNHHLWATIRAIAAANGCHGLGEEPDAATVRAQPRVGDRRMVHALLDLYHATGASGYLTAATEAGMQLLRGYEHAPRWRDAYAGCLAPQAADMLAVLHLAAALCDRGADLPIAFV